MAPNIKDSSTFNLRISKSAFLFNSGNVSSFKNKTLKSHYSLN